MQRGGNLADWQHGDLVFAKSAQSASLIVGAGTHLRSASILALRSGSFWLLGHNFVSFVGPLANRRREPFCLARRSVAADGCWLAYQQKNSITASSALRRRFGRSQIDGKKEGCKKESHPKENDFATGI